MNTVEMTPAGSSMLHSVGYDKEAQELHCRFAENGPLYIYHEVPPETHAALMAAESKGKHFIAHVKGKFQHTKREAQHGSPQQ